MIQLDQMTYRQMEELRLAVQMSPRPQPKLPWQYWAWIWGRNLVLVALILVWCAIFP